MCIISMFLHLHTYIAPSHAYKDHACNKTKERGSIHPSHRLFKLQQYVSQGGFVAAGMIQIAIKLICIINELAFTN